MYEIDEKNDTVITVSNSLGANDTFAKVRRAFTTWIEDRTFEKTKFVFWFGVMLIMFHTRTTIAWIMLVVLEGTTKWDVDGLSSTLVDDYNSITLLELFI